MAYVCTLSEELQEKAKRELNEDPERRAEDIEHIRKWIQSQPHLNIRTDDFFILRFLRGCKFSLEKTEEKIDQYFTLKTISLARWSKNRDPQDPTLREILKLGVMLPLKETDKNGARVLLLRQDSYDTSIYRFNDLAKAILLLMDVFFEVDEINQINGLGFIFDAKGLGTRHLFHYSLYTVKQGLIFWQNGYVAENLYWNFINDAGIFYYMYKIGNIFLNEEIKNKIKLNGSKLEQMYETVPQRILPNEYGGEGGSIQEIADYWLEVIDSKREWILEDDKNTVDESKRPEK